MTQMHRDVEACVDAVLSDAGTDIVLAIPIGIGKPNHFVNALFARAVGNPKITLKIFTGLTFMKPFGGSELERRFTGPIVERLFGGYPDLEYALALRRNSLPSNIQVHEFFMQAGAFLHSPIAQQGYTSLNYTHVAKHILSLGVNVVGQLIATEGDGDASRFSLGSNTDVTLDILPALIERRRNGARIAVVGQVNRAMPFMEGEAAVPASTFDHILDAQAYEFPLFAPPKVSVTTADYAAAIHTAALIKDGGTIQLGIGAFSDALAHALILRHTESAQFARLAKTLGAGVLHPRLPLETAPFEKGLYGATELFVDGYIALYRAGILKRRVSGKQRADVADSVAPAPPEDGDEAVLHAGFFFGPNSFYDALRNLSQDDRRAFQMTSISFVNQLYGAEGLKRKQRPHARFVNSAMMATLLGDAVSDQLEDGRVVSGVGGQYNFVAQAHELEDGRSILELHASRLETGKPKSNIRWAYGHTTIPRHLRDIVVTEYGAADLRGLSDRDTIASMLCIAGSRFQGSLTRQAKDAGKLERAYELPIQFRNNTPARIGDALGTARAEGVLPDFPFGTEMTAHEIQLLPALERLQAAQHSPLQLARLFVQGKPWATPGDRERLLLARLNLDTPKSLKEQLYSAMVLGALR